MDTRRNIFIDENNNNINYIYEDDIDMLTLDDDNNSSSTITEANEVGSFTTERINNNDEILQFT
jgi:hypothetical protein